MSRRGVSISTDAKNWVIALLLVALCGSTLFPLLSAFLATPQVKNSLKDMGKTSESSFGLDDKDIWLYLEGLARIKEDALFLEPGVTREEIVQETLKTYLARKDPFSDYLTRKEYHDLRESQNERYVGIGMEVERDRTGKIICRPYPGSPAEKAGISIGDQLKSVNGVFVDGKSLFTIISMAKGKPETSVHLLILTKSGLEKQVGVTRGNIVTETIAKRRLGKRPVIKISSFVQNTRAKLRDILHGWEANDPIIIDLRSNAGGDLHAAIDSAMLLLEEGKKLISIKTRKGSKTHESSGGAVNLTSPVYLWQNEGTASAAEVFIAALTENQRAVSIGKSTFGKATMQDIFELSDGSALVLTTGELQTPNGTSYQGFGLTPTYTVKDVNDTAGHYMEKVEELIRLKRHGAPTGVSGSTLSRETSKQRSVHAPRTWPSS
ncbi:MAG TPA: S41 family peptidase [Candidatus Tectomicrobia bacterium]